MPSYAQAKKIIWDAINNDGKKILDYFPPQIVKERHKQDLKITLTNGSIFQLIGSDNIDSLVGTNPKLLVFSEYAIQQRTVWDYLRPIIKINNGTAIFISTPRGKNHFYDLTLIAKQYPDDWYYESLTIDDTGVLTKEDIDQERREGMSEEMIQQEYYVSFDRGVDGSYYGKILDEAKRAGRIGHVDYEPRSVVHTAWDIGYGDSTAIVFWQDVGSECRIIDCYEAHGEGIAHYIKHLQTKPYVYGKHYMPHDAGSGSIQTGTSLQRVAADLGLQTIILPREEIELGIESTRSMLSVSYIDESKCKHLIKCLENYHKKYNEKLNVYSSTPEHDFSSHMADATRYASRARELYGRTGTASLTKERILDMRKRNLGY